MIPNVRIKTITFKGNKAIVDVENFSDVPGYEVGLTSTFFFVEQKVYSSLDKGEELSYSLAQQYFKEKKQLYHSFHLSSKTDLTYKGKHMEPKDYVTFLITDLNEATVLPHKKAKVVVEPEFYIEEKKQLPTGQILNYEKLKEVLLQNEQLYVAINIDLVYKDKLETPMGFEPYANFIIAFKRHKTLEEAWREGIGYNFLPLSQGEIQRKLKGIPLSQYKNVKSRQSAEMLEKLNEDWF